MTFDPQLFDRFEQFKRLPTESISKNCVACGVNNPEGLKMTFFTDGRRVCSKVFVPETKMGWDAIIHGGVISIIMDEIMAWGAICAAKKIIFTKNISVDYKRPIFVNSEVRVASWVEEITDKEAKMRAVALNSKNILSAEASGKFALMSGKLASKMSLLSRESVDKFEAFLNNI